MPAFLAAAAVMAVGAVSVVAWPLRDTTGLSRELAVFMPDPMLAADPDPGCGPVLVTLTDTVEEDRAPAFLELMGQLRLSRLRTGAIRCELFRGGTARSAVRAGLRRRDLGRTPASSPDVQHMFYVGHRS